MLQPGTADTRSATTKLLGLCCGPVSRLFSDSRQAPYRNAHECDALIPHLFSYFVSRSRFAFKTTFRASMKSIR